MKPIGGFNLVNLGCSVRDGVNGKLCDDLKVAKIEYPTQLFLD